MALPRRRFLRLAAGAAALPAVARLAQAQTFPSKPMTLIVPWPPGGTTDVAVRALAALSRQVSRRSLKLMGGIGGRSSCEGLYFSGRSVAVRFPGADFLDGRARARRYSV